MQFKRYLTEEEKRPLVVIDTSHMDPERDQWKIGMAAEVGNGYLVSWHVTDKPEKIIQTLASPKKLTATYRKGAARYAELGPGLYLSAAPQMWACRSQGKYDFLKKLTPEEAHRLYQSISNELIDQRSRRYITQSEFDAGFRDLRNWITQQENNPEAYNFIIHLAGQPFNISYWKPEFLKNIDIAGASPPKTIKFRLKGKFVDLSGQYGHISQWSPYIRQGFQGAFIKMDPQMVVWDKNAIIDYVIEKQSIC